MQFAGWVLWRFSSGQTPKWHLGTLSVVDEAVSFEPADVSKRDRFDQSRWVVPGFVDLHSHLAIESDGFADSDLVRKNALDEVRSGVLAIRQPGSPVQVSLGDLPYVRPIVVDAGRHIALEKRYLRSLAKEISTSGPGTVADRLAGEVRRQAELGTGWVKLVGDWIDRSKGSDSDLEPLWSAQELSAAVQAAQDRGSKVAVHTFAHETIDDLIDVGVDSIEHGSGMSLEQMLRAAEANIPVVPTTSQVLKFPEFAGAATRYPRYATRMRAMYDHRYDWFQNLLDSGIEILPGSDAGGYQRHGSVVEEVQRWTNWGMPVEDALNALTWKARDFLGLDSLSEGAPADLLVFDQDPRRSAQAWSAPEVIIANGFLVGGKHPQD